jgi:hypothetical protein
MADIQVANTDADLSGNTVVTEENTYTITGLHTYSRGSNAPFACISGSAYVQYLDVDKLDGQEGAYYLAAANATGTLAVNRGGTGAATFTDGGVLLGSGTSAITATAVLGDGVILIGDASGDPTTLDVGSSSAITILGTVATGVWNGTAVTVAYGGTGATSLTDGGVLLGSGTGAITAMSVLADSEMIVGNGSTDPVAESGATLRTSIGVGTGDSPQFTGLTISGTGASALDVGGGINAGTGDVALVGTDGKINGPLSSTIIDDLSGANLTTLSASNISSGTLANARLPSNVDLGGTLDVTGVTTLDSTLGVASDVAVATSVLFVDASENAIGVGTATPNYLSAPAAITLQGSTQPRVEIVGTRTGDDTTGQVMFINRVSSTNYPMGYIAGNRSGADNSGSLTFHTYNAGSAVAAMTLSPAGALSKASGSFKIDHPLPSKTDTHYLVHSFIEGPRADLIYRGSATLVAGSATVDLDTAAEMTDGTWVLLCRDPQVFTSNESGWDAVRGSVSGKTLTISCQDATSTDTVSWMVVAERQDQHMYDTDWTDDEGHVIVEPEKPEEPEP